MSKCQNDDDILNIAAKMYVDYGSSKYETFEKIKISQLSFHETYVGILLFGLLISN